jgi:chromosome segregation ATPase
MDSIRPDEDELRADAPIGGKVRKTGKSKAAERPASGAGGGRTPPPPSAGGSGGRPGGSSGGLVWSLLIVLVVVIAGAGWFGWQMHQQVQTMETQVEEADYWARQSKLALARFEGDLSETGENLQETGSDMDERLGGLDTKLAEANDEIRKLWVLANEKNRPRIASLAEQQDSLTGQLETLASDLEATGQSVAELQGRTESLSSTLEQTRQDHQQNGERLQTLSGKLESVNERLGGVDEQVARQLQRFKQEQALTLNGLDSRLEALETGDNRVQALSQQLSATRNRLAEAEQTLESVDASRAQLTSRLVRLQEQVDQLRAR